MNAWCGSRSYNFRLEIVNGAASGWATGRTQEAIESEARRRIKGEKGMQYPEKRRTS